MNNAPAVHPIEKVWVWQETESGKPHRVAQYFLASGVVYGSRGVC